MNDDLASAIQGALSETVAAWDDQVVITTDETTNPPTAVILHGVQSDVDVDPQQLEQFGFKVKRVFALVVNDPALVVTIKQGMRAVDQNGEPCRFLHYKRDLYSTLLYFGSVNS
jgi:hypothetical protein